MRGLVGRPNAYPSIEEIEELTLEQVKDIPRAKDGGSRVKKLRDSHHMVARLMALGLENQEIAAQTGYSINRIGMFTNDPALKELVTHYREILNGEFKESVDEYFQTMIRVRMTSLRLIADKLGDAEPGDIPLNQLHTVHADLASRTGYPQRKESVNLNLDFADTLERAVQRSRQVRQIEAKALPVPATGDGAGRVPEASNPPETVERVAAPAPISDAKPRAPTIRDLLPQPRQPRPLSFRRDATG